MDVPGENVKVVMAVYVYRKGKMEQGVLEGEVDKVLLLVPCGKDVLRWWLAVISETTVVRGREDSNLSKKLKEIYRWPKIGM